jgi:3-oxoacyl-[acyl-carrier protein] reductase
MAGKLEDRVALVTGAGRGIGREIARKLGLEGARLVLNDLDIEPNRAVVEEMNGLGIAAVACPGSVAAPDFAERLVKTAMGAYGTIDIVVNNAGYTWDSVIQKMTDEQWYAILDVHLTGPMRILRAVQPVIRDKVRAEREAGTRIVRKVVNISSIAGIFGNAGQSNYASAKAGIIALTQTLAKEWGRIETTVNCVAFGLIRTRLTAVEAGSGATETIEGRQIKVGINPDILAMMERTIPLGRAGTPEEAANAVYLFCIPESDYVSGQTLVVSGGLTGF